jgi:hypothetical protein
MATYVLVHGAWHTGAELEPVATDSFDGVRIARKLLDRHRRRRRGRGVA